MKRWLSDKRRFTDLINGSMFQGKEVFSADTLREENTDKGIVLQNSDGKKITIQRYRDIAMSAEDGTRIVILACENQEEIHYAMPVRGMLYDAVSYADQITRIRQQRREKKELKGSAQFPIWSEEDRFVVSSHHRYFLLWRGRVGWTKGSAWPVGD